MSSSSDYVDDIGKYVIKEVPNFPMYYATECGRVISKHQGRLKFINGKIDKDGYRNLILYNEGKKFYYKNSRVIIITFKGDRPEGNIIRNIDGNPINDAIYNLAYSTQKDNMADKILHGTKIQGEHSPNSKLSEKAVVEIISRMGEEPTSVLAKDFNVDPSTICDIKYGRGWKHIPRNVKLTKPL